MDEIIKDLKESKLFNCIFLRIFIYIITLTYSFLVLWIIFDTILWINYLYNVEKISSNIWSIWIILYLLTFISLIKWWSDEIIKKEREVKNNDEKLIKYISENDWKYTKKEVNDYFINKFKINLDKNNTFSNLISDKAMRISSLRITSDKWKREWPFNWWNLIGNDLWPLIIEKDKKLILTNEWKKVFKELWI